MTGEDAQDDKGSRLSKEKYKITTFFYIGSIYSIEFEKYHIEQLG